MKRWLLRLATNHPSDWNEFFLSVSNSIVKPELLFVVTLVLQLPCGTAAQMQERQQVRVAVRLVHPRLQLVFQVRPKYPKQAKDAGIEGKVELQCIVKEDGSVGEVFVVEGKEPFIHAAKAAVAQWKYKAPMLKGVPVQSDTIVTVIFEILKEKSKGKLAPLNLLDPAH